jgi:ABC-type sugar transport system, periplasmic component
MDRRSFLSLAALGGVGLGLGLAGCSSTPSGSAAPGGAYTPPKKDISATLSYAIWDASQKPVMQKIVDDFNKIYPNIKINIELTPSAGSAYWTKITTLAQGNNLPDVFWMNGPHIQLFGSNKQLLSLEPLVKAGAIKTSNYPTALADLYTVDGTLYGAPKDFDTIGIYYNKDLLQQAGVAVPQASWTWADLKSAGKTLSSHFSGKGIFGFAGDLTGGQTSWYNTMLAAGGYIISPDHKKSGYDQAGSIKGLQFWTDLIDAKISPSMQQLTTTIADDWFTSGKLAMVMAGDWSTTPYKQVVKNLGVVQLPTGPKSNQCVIHGLGNVIAANTKHPDAALAFVSYLGGKAPAQAQASAGLVIPAYNGSQAAYAASQPGLDLQLFLDEAKTASPYPISKNTSAWNQFETNLLPAAFAGQKPVAQVAKALADQMNAELAKE